MEADSIVDTGSPSPLLKWAPLVAIIIVIVIVIVIMIIIVFVIIIIVSTNIVSHSRW